MDDDAIGGWVAIVVLAGIAWWYFGTPKINTYTLYRNSVLDQSMRLHVSTFNVDDHETYNASACSETADLYNGSPYGVSQKYWCEKGKFKD